MQPSHTDHSLPAIEQRILELLGQDPTLTFTGLANTLPNYRWISLLRALNQLEKHQAVRLTPLPWDYEISLATDLSPAPRRD